MKEWYQSKTFWFNVLTALITIATFFGYTPNQEIANQTTTYLLVIAPAVNLLLRYVTTKGIRLWN